jgi:membrane-associated phospholipid phosphatase
MRTGLDGASIDGHWYTAMLHVARDTPWLHGFLLIYTNYGLVLFALLLLARWWTARGADPRVMAAALWSPAAVLLAYGCSTAIKLGAQELRPCRAIAGVVTAQPCPPLTDYSFPSNHAVLAASATVALLLVDRRLGIVAAVLALLMGFSRVYVGAHYPHDVFAGLALGALVGCTGLVARSLLADPVRRLRGGRLAPLLGSPAEPVETGAGR